MSLDSIIKVTIDRNTTTPTRTGFGTTLLLGYFPSTVFPERIRAFSSLQELRDVGFQTFDPIYLMAQDHLAQNPSPGTFKVGRRLLFPSQVITLTPTDLTVGKVYTVTVRGTNNATYASRAATVDTATYTVQSGDTATLICNGLRTSFGTQAGDFSDTGTSTLIITALNTHATVEGQVFAVEPSDGFTVVDGTPDSNVDTDLGQIAAIDNDWYGFCLDCNSKADILDAAAFAESNKKIFVCQTQDTAAAVLPDDPVTGSVAAQLANNEYERSMLFYHPSSNRDYAAAAMLGRALPTTPGSITWAYKTLASIAAQSLSTNQLNTLMGSIDTPGGKYVNAYISQSGIGHTRFGTASSGEFIDVMHGTDWLEARIKEDIFAALVQEDKLPMTDAGINVIKGLILGRLWEGVSNGFLKADPEPSVTVPRAVDIPVADRAARKLTGVTFRAYLAGAIHYTVIEGELNL